jgi:hypothetical protein
MGAYESSRCGCLSLGLRGTELGREDFTGFFEEGRREGTTECGVKRAQSGRRKFKAEDVPLKDRHWRETPFPVIQNRKVC